MYWKLLLPTKYAFRRSITNGIFYPAEQKLYPSEIIRLLIDEIDWGSDDIQWDNDSYSNLLFSSSREWDNVFVVSQISSTAVLSVPESTTSSLETPDPCLEVIELNLILTLTILQILTPVPVKAPLLTTPS